uniref:MADF domain-containing protein n=1 Tax=Caenorhabditis tropicalis TaxID=1561998 RepID=A0A1I7U819_9PELO
MSQTLAEEKTEVKRDGSPKDPLEDDFLLALIEAVQRNPCIYNRYDPLHKVTDYKHGVWRMISDETGYDGQPVELERKWKHMRDKYVRLRKQDKQKAPIKKTNKWYNYYTKMSFLDPYVEHRNRKSQKEPRESSSMEVVEEEELCLEEFNIKTILEHEGFNGLGYESPLTSSSSSSSANGQTLNLESPSDESEEKAKNLALMYEKMVADEQSAVPINGNNIPLLAPVLTNGAATTSTESRARKRKPIPVKIRQESPPPEKKVADRPEESQLNLFIHAVTETMTRLDRKKFAKASIEISKVLYAIEFGKNQFADDAKV